MNVLVIGATGGTGQALVERGAARGWTMVALVRQPEAIRHTLPNVRFVEGNALLAESVSSALNGVDAVVSALGTRPWKHVDVCSAGAAALLSAFASEGARRTVVMSSFGVQATRAQTTAIERAFFFDTIIRKSLIDKALMESMLLKSASPWTVVRPGMLTNGHARGAFRAADDGSIGGGFLRIARTDVADFMLDQLVSERWLHRAPTLAY